MEGVRCYAPIESDLEGYCKTQESYYVSVATRVSRGCRQGCWLAAGRSTTARRARTLSIMRRTENPKPRGLGCGLGRLHNTFRPFFKELNYFTRSWTVDTEQTLQL